MKPQLLIPSAVLVIASLTSAADENWTRFRGPNGSGIAASAKPPTTWSDTKNLKWRTTLPGAGASSPIVWGERVFATCHSGDMPRLQRHLVCVNRRDGKILWSKSVAAAQTEDEMGGRISEHGYASHTPTTDGERVYVFFGKSGVLAFDFNGTQLWQTDVGTGSNQKHWGSASSLMLYRNLLIVTASEESRSIRALDSKTGREIWKAEGSQLNNVFGTPVLVESEGRTDLVIAVPDELWGLNPETGKLRWFAMTGLRGNITPGVVAENGIIYACGGFPQLGAVAVRAGGKGDVTKTHILWSGSTSTYVPTAVLHQGHLYFVCDAGLATCLNAKTGEVVFKERLPGVSSSGRGGKPFYSSTVLANGCLYAVSRRQGTFVIAAKPKFEFICQNKFDSDDSEWNATPAIVGNQLLLRSNRFLYSVESGEKNPGLREVRDSPPAATTVAASVPISSQVSGFALIPAGKFEMGDHHGFVDPKHGSDEMPLHAVRLDAFHIGIYDVTTREYCEFLNSALAQRWIEVRRGGVYLVGGNDLLCDTRESTSSSEVGWDGRKFSVLDKKENHPMVCVRWHGAAFYCNWLGAQKGLPICYNTGAWECDFNKSGFRLPTEAEWEYAARGGQQSPYYNYPWGDDADPAKANVPESRNPFRSFSRSAAPAGGREAGGPIEQARRLGPQPRTTPVGFFNGKLQRKSDFNWPGEQETFQTANGANGFGLYDMAGNVWQWCTEWYERNYYAYSPSENPPGSAEGSPMPDGKTYRCMRGGSWFNGEFGHSRVSNRDPSYYRGADPVTGRGDPDGSYFHIGFRVVRPVNAESRAVIKPTPVQRVAGREGKPSGKGGPAGGERGGQSDERPAGKGGPRQDRFEESNILRKPNASFVLRSSAMTNGGTIPKEFTGEGDSVNPPLEWFGAPGGTKSYALIMHHATHGETISYWVLYNVSANVQSLPKDVKGIGTLGLSSRGNHAGYSPPHSAGPGTRRYVFTVFALSAPVQISGAASSEALQAAMKGKLLASADMSVNYTRYTVTSGGSERSGEDQRKQLPPDGERRGGDMRSDRPPGKGGSDGGERRGGGGGRLAENNKTPTSPNPGQTVGLFLNTPKAFDGYTLLAPKHNTNTYLINNAGRVIRQWTSQYYPGQSVYLKPNGNLLHPCMTRNRSFTGGGEGGRIEEYDWNGKLIWEFPYATDKYQQHHDIAPLPNGNILMLVVEKKTAAECIAAGWPAESVQDMELYPDGVVEVQPIYPSNGKVVWEWRVWNHMVQEFDKTKANYGEIAAHPELIAIRGGRGGPTGFWNHANSIAYNAKLDQIIVSARGQSEIWFIDHSTTTKEAAGHTGGRHGKGGDLIYRWGNPSAYKRGSERDAQLNQQHDAQWIPDGCPGAGHVTIFNNGYNRGYTSIEEIVPSVDANGRYILEPGKPYGPEKPAWHYEAKNRTEFFSSEISGAHRLPNGNTLICAGVIGHLFEVTVAGEMVWQYVNPGVRYGVLAQGELPGKDVRGHLFNAVFKAHRYAPDYPGLRGRDLTPKGVIELPASMKGKTGLDQANATESERPGGKGAGKGKGKGKGGDNRDERPTR